MLVVAALLAIVPAISAAQGQTLAQTKQKNDCVIVAAEAYKRLQALGVWAKVIGFTWKAPDGTKGGHAVCLFQLSKTDNILVYDAQFGTSDLNVKSADLQVIEQAYNRLIASSGYTVSGFEVMVQEPRKASRPEGVLSTQEAAKTGTADSRPQASKPAARTAMHSRMDSRPASAQKQMFRTESSLLRFGFKAIKVNSAKLQRVVNELRQGKMSCMNYNGQLYYVYPAATKDKIYIGTQAQFNAFVGIRSPVAANQSQGVNPPASYPFNPRPPTPPYLR